MDFNNLINNLPKHMKDKAKSMLTALALSASKVEKESMTQLGSDSDGGIKHVQENNKFSVIDALVNGQKNAHTQQFVQWFYQVLEKADEYEKNTTLAERVENSKKYKLDSYYRGESEEEKKWSNALDDFMKKNQDEKFIMHKDLDEKEKSKWNQVENDRFEDSNIDPSRVKETKDIISESTRNTDNDWNTENTILKFSIKNDRISNKSMSQLMSNQKGDPAFYTEYIKQNISYRYEDYVENLHIKKQNNSEDYWLEFYIDPRYINHVSQVEKGLYKVRFTDQYGKTYHFVTTKFSHLTNYHGWCVIKFRAYLEKVNLNENNLFG